MDKFAPELQTNRAMLVTILWRMEGSPMSEKATAFTDIHADDYFYQAVLWAAENGIVSGMSETSFAPSRKTGRFKVLATAGTHLFILLFQQVEILIST